MIIYKLQAASDRKFMSICYSSSSDNESIMTNGKSSGHLGLDVDRKLSNELTRAVVPESFESLPPLEQRRQTRIQELLALEQIYLNEYNLLFNNWKSAMEKSEVTVDAVKYLKYFQKGVDEIGKLLYEILEGLSKGAIRYSKQFSKEKLQKFYFDAVGSVHSMKVPELIAVYELMLEDDLQLSIDCKHQSSYYDVSSNAETCKTDIMNSLSSFLVRFQVCLKHVLTCTPRKHLDYQQLREIIGVLNKVNKFNASKKSTDLEKLRSESFPLPNPNMKSSTKIKRRYSWDSGALKRLANISRNLSFIRGLKKFTDENRESEPGIEDTEYDKLTRQPKHSTISWHSTPKTSHVKPNERIHKKLNSELKRSSEVRNSPYRGHVKKPITNLSSSDNNHLYVSDMSSKSDDDDGLCIPESSPTLLKRHQEYFSFCCEGGISEETYDSTRYIESRLYEREAAGDHTIGSGSSMNSDKTITEGFHGNNDCCKNKALSVAFNDELSSVNVLDENGDNFMHQKNNKFDYKIETNEEICNNYIRNTGKLKNESKIEQNELVCKVRSNIPKADCKKDCIHERGCESISKVSCDRKNRGGCCCCDKDQLDDLHDDEKYYKNYVNTRTSLKDCCCEDGCKDDLRECKSLSSSNGSTLDGDESNEFAIKDKLTISSDFNNVVRKMLDTSLICVATHDSGIKVGNSTFYCDCFDCNSSKSIKENTLCRSISLKRAGEDCCSSCQSSMCDYSDRPQSIADEKHALAAPVVELFPKKAQQISSSYNDKNALLLDISQIQGSDEDSDVVREPRNPTANANKSKSVMENHERNTMIKLPGKKQKVSRNHVMKWASGIDLLLADKRGIKIFQMFLKSEFSEENILFWLACENFKFTNSFKLAKEASRIYKTFIKAYSINEVNIDHVTRSKIRDVMSQPHRSMFDEAQNRIKCLMAQDSYPRFLKSSAYQSLLS